MVLLINLKLCATTFLTISTIWEIFWDTIPIVPMWDILSNMFNTDIIQPYLSAIFSSRSPLLDLVFVCSISVFSLLTIVSSLFVKFGFLEILVFFNLFSNCIRSPKSNYFYSWCWRAILSCFFLYQVLFGLFCSTRTFPDNRSFLEDILLETVKWFRLVIFVKFFDTVLR